MEFSVHRAEDACVGGCELACTTRQHPYCMYGTETRSLSIHIALKLLESSQSHRERTHEGMPVLSAAGQRIKQRAGRFNCLVGNNLSCKHARKGHRETPVAGTSSERSVSTASKRFAGDQRLHRPAAAAPRQRPQCLPVPGRRREQNARWHPPPDSSDVRGGGAPQLMHIHNAARLTRLESSLRGQDA
eukprot:357274-Chlamydomonas_euryale.AAC.23